MLSCVGRSCGSCCSRPSAPTMACTTISPAASVRTLSKARSSPVKIAEPCAGARNGAGAPRLEPTREPGLGDGRCATRTRKSRDNPVSKTDSRRTNMAENLEKLKDWIGQKEGGTDYVTVPLVERLAATLDLDAFPQEGEPLPVGWHMALFPRVV